MNEVNKLRKEIVIANLDAKYLQIQNPIKKYGHQMEILLKTHLYLILRRKCKRNNELTSGE